MTRPEQPQTHTQQPVPQHPAPGEYMPDPAQNQAPQPTPLPDGFDPTQPQPHNGEGQGGQGQEKQYNFEQFPAFEGFREASDQYVNGRTPYRPELNYDAVRDGERARLTPKIIEGLPTQTVIGESVAESQRFGKSLPTKEQRRAWARRVLRAKDELRHMRFDEKAYTAADDEGKKAIVNKMDRALTPEMRRFLPDETRNELNAANKFLFYDLDGRTLPKRIAHQVGRVVVGLRTKPHRDVEAMIEADAARNAEQEGRNAAYRDAKAELDKQPVSIMENGQEEDADKNNPFAGMTNAEILELAKDEGNLEVMPEDDRKKFDELYHAAFAEQVALHREFYPPVEKPTFGRRILSLVGIKPKEKDTSKSEAVEAQEPEEPVEYDSSPYDGNGNRKDGTYEPEEEPEDNSTASTETEPTDEEDQEEDQQEPVYEPEDFDKPFTRTRRLIEKIQVGALKTLFSFPRGNYLQASFLTRTEDGKDRPTKEGKRFVNTIALVGLGAIAAWAASKGIDGPFGGIPADVASTPTGGTGGSGDFLKNLNHTIDSLTEQSNSGGAGAATGGSGSGHGFLAEIQKKLHEATEAEGRGWDWQHHGAVTPPQPGEIGLGNGPDGHSIPQVGAPNTPNTPTMTPGGHPIPDFDKVPFSPEAKALTDDSHSIWASSKQFWVDAGFGDIPKPKLESLTDSLKDLRVKEMGLLNADGTENKLAIARLQAGTQLPNPSPRQIAEMIALAKL